MTERWSPEKPKISPEQEQREPAKDAPKGVPERERTSTQFREEFEKLKADKGSDSRESALRGLARDVEERQNVIDSATENEREKLNAVRANLGMEREIEGENTHPNRASDSEKKALDSLHGEIDQELRQGKEGRESAEHAARIRKNVGEVGRALEIFSFEIRRREQDGLDPLFDSRAFSSLRSGFNSLQTIAEGTGDFSQEELASAFGQITRGLEQMGPTGRGSMGRDPENELGRLNARARGISDTLDTLRRELRSGDELIAGTARRLSETADNAVPSLRSRFRDKR